MSEAFYGDGDVRFVVTGASGWLGRATLATLKAALGTAFDRRVLAYGSRDGDVSFRSGERVAVQALGRLRDLPAGRYCFLHLAFLTREKVAALPLKDYVRRNRDISECVAAAGNRVSLAGFFLPSSGAVYRKDRTLDSDLAQNPYGVLKLEDEARFSSLSERWRCPLVVARVFNLSGPYINKIDSYVLAAILNAIRQNRPIELKARHLVLRSYVHVCDLMTLVFSLLSVPSSERRFLFDTAGETVVEIGDLAQLALRIMGVSDGRILRPILSDEEPEDRYVGDGAAMAGLAAERGVVFRPLAEQIRDTAAYLAAV